jgi:uncharacterized membrane protein
MNYLTQQGWEVAVGLWWIIGLVIFLGVVFVILKTGTSKRKRQKEREVLSQRLERGEIDQIKYERRLRIIAEKERFYQH